MYQDRDPCTGQMLRTYEDASAADHNPAIMGVHLEGPFIAQVFKGAQPEQYIIYPDDALLDQW